ncbi:MAG: molecular chaperone Tir, partial [Coleofasciculaceae cyanobacterium]
MPRSLRVAPGYIDKAKAALLRNGFPRQQDLADELGISRDLVSRFLNGHPVRYLNFLEICQKLGQN